MVVPRPYRLFTGGEDKAINFYEGPPFKFKHSHNTASILSMLTNSRYVQVHNNFVACIRCSPNGDVAVSVAMDKKVYFHHTVDLTCVQIVFYDALNGDVKEQLTDKTHDGSILILHSLRLTLPQLSQASLLPTMRTLRPHLWISPSNSGASRIRRRSSTAFARPDSNLTNSHYKISEKPELGDMQLGVAVSNTNLISLSLDGSLNVWQDFKTISQGSLPTRRILGHNVTVPTLISSQLLCRLQ